MRKTKIISTVWPATDNIEKIEELYKAWVNIIRLNFSHWNHEYFKNLINIIKELNIIWKTNLSILLDNKWPEIRTKKIENSVNIEQWEKFIMTSLLKEEKIINNNLKIISCDYEYIVEDLNIWHIVDIDSSLLKAEVIEKNENFLVCKALNFHIIKSLRHVNLPWIKLKLPWITDKDKLDIIFWIKNEIDFIALSFVRNKENILEVRELLNEHNSNHIKIISKIENQEALDNIDEIIENSDWVMIARWDLWSEVDLETLPFLQKMIWEKAKQAWKFFIVATQMLESMISNPVPTRAEINDIYTACEQAADCTMLSWETAAWKYPIESVIQMLKVINFAETQIIHNHNYLNIDLKEKNDKKYLLKNSLILAENLNAKAIIIFTRKWFMARTLAAYRPNLPVFAFSFEDKLVKKLNILFWINSFKIEKIDNEENVENAIKILLEKNLIKFKDKIVTLYDIEKDWKIIPSVQIREV